MFVRCVAGWRASRTVAAAALRARAGEAVFETSPGGRRTGSAGSGDGPRRLGLAVDGCAAQPVDAARTGRTAESTGGGAL